MTNAKQEPAEDVLVAALPAEPTSAEAWPSKSKALAGTLATLPSGAVARICDPPLQYLYVTGRVPPKIGSLLRKGGLEILADPMNKMDDEQRRLFMDWMIAESFIEPKVSMTRKAGTIYIGDLIDQDKAAVIDALSLRIGG
jgi:hypothetical protein